MYRGNLRGRRFFALVKKAEENIPSKLPSGVHRVEYEYPPPPRIPPKPPRESSAWRRHFPLLMGLGGLGWALYAWNYIFNSPGEETSILTPDKFAKFRVTCRQELTPDLALIELSPKYHASVELMKSGSRLWNGKKLWSVQVKHPDIQIGRHYTPLPLYFMQSPGTEPLLRITSGEQADDGRFVVLVKKYADGEMSRYLHSLPPGSDVELRGPFIEHQFNYTKADMQEPRAPMQDVPTRVPPDSPDLWGPNIAFYTGGTGIAPALQCLLSPFNPPKGFVHVFHSVKSREEIPVKRFLFFLESAGRSKFHFFVDNENKYLQASDIPQPTAFQEYANVEEGGSRKNKKYKSALQQNADPDYAQSKDTSPNFAVVCGPPGYITFVSGDPGLKFEKDIGGLLGLQGWTKDITTRMRNI